MAVVVKRCVCLHSAQMFRCFIALHFWTYVASGMIYWSVRARSWQPPQQRRFTDYLCTSDRSHYDRLLGIWYKQRVLSSDQELEVEEETDRWTFYKGKVKDRFGKKIHLGLISLRKNKHLGLMNLRQNTRLWTRLGLSDSVIRHVNSSACSMLWQLRLFDASRWLSINLVLESKMQLIQRFVSVSPEYVCRCTSQSFTACAKDSCMYINL